MTAPPELLAVFDEIQRRRVETPDPNIVHIRVSHHALPGSIAVMPMTHERARTLGYVTDPLAPFDPRMPREILIHHEDWARIKIDDRFALHMTTDGRFDLFGLPVVTG